MSRSCWYSYTPRVGRSGAALSVVNYSDWQVRFLSPADDTRSERADDWWLRPTTLTFLQRHPQGVTTRCLYLTHVPSGRTITLTAQNFHMNLAAQVRDEVKGETTRWDFRRRLLQPFRSRVLVLGQLLTSGDYGQDGLQQLGSSEASHLLPAVAQTLMELDQGYRAVLLKDLFAANSPPLSVLLTKGYTHLPSDPVMVLPLSWPDLPSYLAALTSKYRVRYRRARGKLAGITRRRLLPQEVRDRIERLYALYTATSGGASVNLTTLTPDYFVWLSGQAVVHGYFDVHEELVGFTTALANGPVYQAHYLGLEDAYKYSHHLYHNMLFDLLEDGLDGKFQLLDYGRTALEIKSSLGAVPREYATLLRLRSPVLNRLVPTFVPAVFTAEAWQQRRPFR
ncbi:hypothetical protein LEM8419_00837 [Neolewinella maritima]|uniref:GNAT family N-acetyltransferase n=1 Tax=Neolewinella maritima TaxID=1383882 RepID=A0ABM9AYM3_9BACT|nr:hypothetical protein [Neolewinella maritima]CAH0999537.1 hypothetical protein LEM8419_00837 [Neolewinella maritima]